MVEIRINLERQALARIDAIVKRAGIYEDRRDFLTHVILHHIEKRS